MDSPHETARLAGVHATLDAVARLLTPIVDGPPIDFLTDADLSAAVHKIRLARDAMYHRVRRNLDVLERHEQELQEDRAAADESRTAAAT